MLLGIRLRKKGTKTFIFIIYHGGGDQHIFLVEFVWFVCLNIFIQINLSHREYVTSIISYRRVQSQQIKNLLKSEYFNLSVAIIIPCYNDDDEDLEKCVRTALDQDYLSPFQVILVDDGSKNKSVGNNVKSVDRKESPFCFYKNLYI